MNMTKAPSTDDDSKIRPQGFTKNVEIDPKYLDPEYNEAEFVNENNAVDNEEIETGWTAEDMEINQGDDDIGDNDVVVDDELEGIDAQLESDEVDMEHEMYGEILT